ncbi:Hydrogenase maturation factor HypB [subsurface metagenome]
MEVKVLTIQEDILGANTEKARRNRDRLDKHGILAVNVMSSPGAGKTSLILQTIVKLKEKARIAVIEGDVASRFDADKIHQQGVPVMQINIPGGCKTR